MVALGPSRPTPCYRSRLLVSPAGNRVGEPPGEARVHPVSFRSYPFIASVQDGSVRHWNAT
eukprot:2418264-Lingulodinium_polyedra.AAC.1